MFEILLFLLLIVVKLIKLTFKIYLFYTIRAQY